MNQQTASISILHLEDSDIDADLVEAHLDRAGIVHRCARVWTREDFTERLCAGGFDLILADYRLPAFDGLKALEIARELAPEIPFIFVSATLGEEVAIESLKNGATDYVVKSRLNRLASCVERAIQERQDREARRAAELAVEQTKIRLSAALSVARIGTFEWDVANDRVMLDQRACEILGIANAQSVRPSDIGAVIEPQDRERVRQEIDRARSERARTEVEFRIISPNGLVRTVAGTCDWFGSREALSGIGVLKDITDRKRAEEQQRLVVRELHHRVKNSLATVQSVVNFALRFSTSIEDARINISHRVAALARSHSLLTEDEFGGLSLRDLFLSELAPYEGDRITLSGPKVFLPTDLAMTFGMAIHELTTNAAKHGALSSPDGRLSVEWSQEQHEDGRLVAISWEENDGPPIEFEPEHEGFGSLLLKRLVGNRPGTGVSFDYAPEGLRMKMRFKLH